MKKQVRGSSATPRGLLSMSISLEPERARSTAAAMVEPHLQNQLMSKQVVVEGGTQISDIGLYRCTKTPREVLA